MHDPDESEGLLPAIDLGPQAALIARDRMAFAFEERRQRNKEQEMLELLHRCAPDKYAMALEQMLVAKEASVEGLRARLGALRKGLAGA